MNNLYRNKYGNNGTLPTAAGWRYIMLLLTALLLSPYLYAQSCPELNCTSNDVQVKGVYLGDANGNKLTSSCTPESTVQAYLYLVVSTNTPRKGALISGTLKVDGITDQVVSNCFGVNLNGDNNILKYPDPVNWTCGSKIMLVDIFVAWGTGNTNFCDGYNGCSTIVTSKCRREAPIVVEAPLIAKFTTQAACTEGNQFQTVTFTSTTTGGKTPYTYAWDFNDDGQTDATTEVASYSFTSSGVKTIKLTVTDSSDPSKSNTRTASITVNSCCTSPTITSQPTSQAACSGDKVSFAVASNGGDPAPDIQWQVNTGAGFVDLAEGGKYTGVKSATLDISGVTTEMSGYQYQAILKSAACPKVTSSTVSLTVNSIASLTNLSDVTICDGPDAEAIFSTSVTGTGASAANVAWYKGDVLLTANEKYSITTNGNQSTLKIKGLAVADGGIYKAMLTGAECGNATKSATLTVNPTPATPDLKEQVFCKAINATVGHLPQGSGMYSYYLKSSGGPALALNTVLASGTYYVQANSGSCKSARSAIAITIIDMPNAEAGEAKKLTCNVKSVQLQGSTTTAEATYMWTASNNGHIVSGENTLTPTVDAAGIYTLTVTTAKGDCIAQDNVEVTNDASVPYVSISSPQIAFITCKVPSVLLGVYTNAENPEFSWTGPDSFTSDKQGITVTRGGIYRVTVINKVNGCSASAEYEVLEYKSVPLSAGPDKKIDCNNTTVILEGTTNVPEHWRGIVWEASNGGNIVSGHYTLTPTVSAAGTYTMTVTDSRIGCEASGAVMVTKDMNAPDISAQGGTLSCENHSLQLKGASTTEGATYRWTGPNNYVSEMQNPTVTMAGDYTLTVKNPANGCSASSTVKVNPQPKAPEPKVTCSTITFNNEKIGLISTLKTAMGPVPVFGKKRNPDGTYAPENHAAIFDSQAPTGDDTDLYTVDWGNILIINQDQTNVPNDNQWGGELILDFSKIGPVTMTSMRALDIDGYENNSWVYLYGINGNELYKVKLQPLGDNSRQTVDLGNTKGVVKMRIVMDGRDGSMHLAGSGAFDDINFCVEEIIDNPCKSQPLGTVEVAHAVAYPSPFSDRATVEFTFGKAGNFTANLYDLRGNLVKELKSGKANAGELTTVEVDGRNLLNGIYIARIVNGSEVKTVKMILRK